MGRLGGALTFHGVFRMFTNISVDLTVKKCQPSLCGALTFHGVFRMFTNISVDLTVKKCQPSLCDLGMDTVGCVYPL